MKLGRGIDMKRNRLRRIVKADLSTAKGIREAERKKARLERMGFNLVDERMTGLDKYRMTYEKK